MEFSLTSSASQHDYFLTPPDQVDSQLNEISPDLTQILFRDAAKVAIDRNKQADNSYSYSNKEAAIQFQQHFSAAIFEQLQLVKWSIRNPYGSKVALSSNHIALAVLTGDYVGSGGDIKSIKGPVLGLAVNEQLLDGIDNIKFWILLFSRNANIIKLELIRPNSVENGKLISCKTRIPLTEIDTNEFDVPVKPLEKTEIIDFEPVRRKKSV